MLSSSLVGPTSLGGPSRSLPTGDQSIGRRLDRHDSGSITSTRKTRPEALNKPAMWRRQRAEDWIYAQISTRGGGMGAADGAGGVRAAERVDRIQESRGPLRAQHARPADSRQDHVDFRVRLEVPGDDLPMDGWSEPLFSERRRLLRL